MGCEGSAPALIVPVYISFTPEVESEDGTSGSVVFHVASCVPCTVCLLSASLSYDAVTQSVRLGVGCQRMQVLTCLRRSQLTCKHDMHDTLVMQTTKNTYLQSTDSAQQQPRMHTLVSDRHQLQPMGWPAMAQRIYDRYLSHRACNTQPVATHQQTPGFEPVAKAAIIV